MEVSTVYLREKNLIWVIFLSRGLTQKIFLSVSIVFVPFIPRKELGSTTFVNPIIFVECEYLCPYYSTLQEKFWEKIVTANALSLNTLLENQFCL